MSVVKKLHRRLRNFTVEIENWEIPDQSVTVLWGESGAGKTTVLNALLGLDSDSEVDWEIHGEQIQKLPPQKRGFGAVFQDLGLFPNMSVEGNILFPVNKKKHANWEMDFKQIVSSLRLENILKSPIDRTSGGEKQRVALARALIYRPRMVFLDEPFSSLDAEMRQRGQNLLKDLSHEWGMTVLMVSHDQGDRDFLAEKITHFKRGRIVSEEVRKG